jgi:DNA uptake protein ComE-like DNA-binding protein
LLQKNISQTSTDSTEKYVWLTGSPERHEGLYLFTPEQLQKIFPKIGPQLTEQSARESNSSVYAIAYHGGKHQPMNLPPKVANIFFKPIPLNRADKNILTSLPGIGPVLAERIVLRRDQYGPFQSKDELLQIAGIGPKKYAGLVDRIILD